MAELPPPPAGLVLTHFIVSDDVERSRRFYTEVLGGRVEFSGPGGLTYVALSDSWIIINVGGGPTDDKPTVTLETPRDPDRVSSFLNIRVKDIAAVYAAWSARGAEFLTPPQTAPVRDPLLHPRSRRTHHRSRTNHGPRRGLDPRSLAIRADDLRDGFES
ncbi:MAG TPA: VOC family protein [Solirubrobacteraceae bacterium]|nr:VOC family protein [Solirubrobacteraceae bacterium]